MNITPARPRAAAATLALLLMTGCTGTLQQAQVASAFTSQLVCIDHFMSGLPVAQVQAERLAPLPGMGLAGPFITVQADARRGEVRTRVAGGFASRAVYSPGWGCRLVDGEAEAAWPEPVPEALPQPAALAGAEPVPPATPALAAALERSFAEDAEHPARHTKAVLVLQRGRLIAEHYAPGVAPQVPLLGFSMSKSVVNALIGVLVQQGRLRLDQPVPLAAWAGRPQQAITLEQLLRQTSGLDLRQDNSGADANARMLLVEHDKAGFAAGRALHAAPGTWWNYTDGHYLLLSRVLADTVGGGPAAVRAFARRELFGPLGMAQMTMAFDGTGTPLGSTFFVAPPRDWARLGQLFLDDGWVAGRRLLPAGWVAMSRTPTLSTGYGAGWWTNVRGAAHVPGWGVPWGLPSAPREAFFARGFMGQYIVVLPAQQMVIVHMASSPLRGDDIAHVDRLVAGVLAALGGTAP